VVCLEERVMSEAVAVKVKIGVWIGAAVWMAVAVPVVLGQATPAVGQPAMASPIAPQAAAPASAAIVPSTMTFDVATVMPSGLDISKIQSMAASGHMPRMGPHVEGLRAEYSFMTLKELITVAYKVKAYQISGLGADQLFDTTTQRFDIVANMPEGSTKDDAPKMLQSLLSERFKLVLHRETKEHPVMALLVAKGGPKLKESPPAAAPIDPDAPLKPGETKMDGPDGSQVRVTRNSDGTITENMGAKGIVTIKMDGQAMHISADTMTMDGFADQLTGLMKMGGGSQTVVDMTGLKGNYQVAFDMSMADLMAAARAMGADLPSNKEKGAAGIAEADDPSGSSVYSSVQKLGLKLEPRKANVEQLVVDQAEKMPTEN